MSKPSSNAPRTPSPADLILSTAYHAEISRRGLARALFAAAGAAVLFGSPVRALAADATQETKDALAAAQKQYDEFQAQMKAIGDQYASIAAAQDKTIGKIEGVQGDIDATQAEIDKKQSELEDKQEGLSNRVSDSYKAGDRNALTLLLSSGSFEELISNTYYLNKVNESDQKAIQSVRDIQVDLKAKKADLEKQKKELEDLKAEQAKQLDQMTAKKEEVQKLLDDASQAVKDLIAKRDAEVLAAAKQEEDARRAAEEAARQRAASGSGSAAPGTPGTSQVSGGAGAQQRVVSACHTTPSPGAGLCAAWVCYVFENAGLGSVEGNANDMYAAWCTSSDMSALKVGMIIAVSAHPHTSLGRIYGHVGIYVGGNTVMDNIGYIRSIDVNEWINFYGGIVTPRWGWANGIVLG